MQQLREDWAKENARKFSAEDYLKCPLYGHVCQDGEACAKDDGEQGKALDIFIKGKAERLAAINERGKALKAELSAKDTAISEAQAKVTEVRNAYVERKAKRDAKLSELDVIQHNSPKQPLTSDIKGTDLPEWEEIGLEIEQKKSLLASMTEHKADFTDGNEGKREAIKARIKAISVELSAVDRIREADKRVYELESELSE